MKVIERRIGKLFGKNSRSAGLFDIQVEKDADGGARIIWRKREDWRDWLVKRRLLYVEDQHQGLDSGRTVEGVHTINRSRGCVSNPEKRFKDKAHMAHILVCFLADALRKTLEGLCRQSGLGDEPRKVFYELSLIKLVDVILPTRNGREIRLKCVGCC